MAAASIIVTAGCLDFKHIKMSKSGQRQREDNSQEEMLEYLKGNLQDSIMSVFLIWERQCV